MDPDHAVISVGATFTAQSATAASDQLASALTGILDTLASFGLDRDSLPTTDFTVQPRMDYETNTVRGYDARGFIQVTIRDLEVTGQIIDAVVAAGANQVGSLDFRASEQRAARDSALTLAVAAARHDAEVLARAVGGELGNLVEVITTQRAVVGGAVAMDEFAGVMAQRVAVPVTPQQVRVTVFVTTRWALARN